MNDRHDMLDDVALYALGTLPPAQARQVRDHIATCEECAKEYAMLRPVVSAMGTTTESCSDFEHGAVVASPLLKGRIMRAVRGDAPSARTVAKTATPLWPAYLVAAACFAIALVSSLFNLSLVQQLKASQTEIGTDRERSLALSQTLASERTTIADLMDQSAKRYALHDGEVVAVRGRLYLTMHGLPALPSGKVYQAWTLAKGSKTMAPSHTFVPDSHGAAIVEIAAAATNTAAVAVSVEPEGGSKAPTTKPVALTSLQ